MRGYQQGDDVGSYVVYLIHENGRWFYDLPCATEAAIKEYRDNAAANDAARAHYKALASEIKEPLRSELLGLLRAHETGTATDRYHQATGQDYKTSMYSDQCAENGSALGHKLRDFTPSRVCMARLVIELDRLAQLHGQRPCNMNLTIRLLTPSLWADLEALFGKGGASNGCWCMYWRIGPEYHKRPREKNKRALHRIVNEGPPPGLLAFDGERPVGWCQLTPRQDLRWLNHKPPLRPLDDVPVWAVSCFYIRRGYRRRGVMTALIVEALKAAKRSNVPALEAYPVDTAQPGSTSNVFPGVASTFRRLGFRTIARRSPSRPIMRHDLRGIAP